METSEILKKVRQIEIKTRGLSNNILQASITRLSRVGVCRSPKSGNISLAMIYVT